MLGCQVSKISEGVLFLKIFFGCLVLLVFFCFLGLAAYANPLDDGNPIVLCPGPNPVFQFSAHFQPKSWNMEVNGVSIPSFVCDGMTGVYWFSTTRALPVGASFKVLVSGSRDEFYGEGIIGPTKELAMGEFRWYSLFERGKSKIFPLNGQCGLNIRTGINAYCQEDDKRVSFRLIELGSGKEFKAENALKFQLPGGQWAACMSPLLGDGRTFFQPETTYRVECRKKSGDLFWYFSTAGLEVPAVEKI